MPDSPEDTSVSSLTRKSSSSIAEGRGQVTPEGSTSDTKARQQESTSVTPPKRATPRDRSTKKNRRPDQQIYVPRRGRQTNRTSSENPQSVKQSIDTKQPTLKGSQQSENPLEGVGDHHNQTDRHIKPSSRAVEAEISSSSKASSIAVQDNLSTKLGNGAVDDRLVDTDVEQCLPSSCRTPDLEDTRREVEEKIVESLSKYRESHCEVVLNDIPCGFQRESSDNDVIQESSTEGVSIACTPAQDQPQEIVCESALKDTRSIRSGNQTKVRKLESECYKVVATQDQPPLPTEEIMADDATRLEPTGVSGNGDDKIAKRVDDLADKGPREDGEKDDVKKEDDEGEEEEDSWDTMFDEEGNSLQEDEVKEITDAVGGISVSVKKPSHDYHNFSPKDTTDYSKLEHVIEAYDFPADFKMEDLVMTFSAFNNKGFDVKWVDETHALIVFTTPQVASDALGLQNPMLRTRLLSLASKQSKQKAKATVEFLQPYRPRPETSSLAARRMVSNALGVKSNVSKEQRDAERQKLKEAKEKKRDDKRQKADVWDGNI